MYADRVKDTTTAPGVGTVTLANAAPTGYQTFAAAFTTGTLVSYCIADQSGSRWEVGTGTFTAPATLTRTTVLASSNGGSLTNFSTGTQDVFCTAPAKFVDTFTSTNQGTVPASGGGTANFLRADGTFAAPPVTAPAGSNTQIQYNNAGAFGASSNFTYTSGTNTLTVGTVSSLSGALVATTPNVLTTSASGSLTLKTGNSASGATGAVNISTGTTSGTRGDINLTSRYTNINSTIYGNAIVTTPYGDWGGSLNIFGKDATGFDYGGFINIKAGSGEVDAGDLNLGSGDAISFGQAGDVYIKAGDADLAGNLYINAGSTLTGNGQGGSVYIRAGRGSGIGGGGSVAIVAGEKQSASLYCGVNGGSINLFCPDTSGTVNLGVYSGVSVINLANQSIGFYNTTPITKPTVTGSRATGVALQNLLTQLAALGLITDSTTA